MKVRALEDYSWGSGTLTKGQVYEVFKEDEKWYWLDPSPEQPSGFGWLKKRFEVVSEEVPTIVAQEAAPSKPKKEADEREEECWRAMRPRVGENECPSCWAPKPCRFHP